MSVIIGIVLFGLCIAIYGYFRLSGRLHTDPMDRDKKGTSSDKLFHSKAQDIAFFDGESEDYAEAQSRLRQYGGG
ncbi:MAG: hypothetical protein ACW96M_07660 [Candidatus Thorarchaeota archaeon]